MKLILNRCFTLSLLGALSIASSACYALAQDVTVTDGRPIAIAIEKLKLEHLYGVAITYEDTLYVDDNEIADVTEAVRIDDDSSNFSRVLVPIDRTITFTLPEANTSETERSQFERSEAALAVMKSVLDSYAYGGGQGDFTVSEDSFGLHVVSRAFTDASGRSQILKPALETKISLTERLQPADDVVEQICRKISSESGIVVIVGAAPTVLLESHLVDVNVKNESAREVLESVSGQIGKPLSWELFCDRNGCMLNMHVVH